MGMARWWAFVVVLFVTGLMASGVQANPFPKGHLPTGKALHDKSCAACHNSMMPNGKGAEIYSEDFRKMQTASQVKTMIEVCASRSRAGWFEEEIEHAGRYLNDTYYQYKN
jgi:mono/diheme cytochrome c family protein